MDCWNFTRRARCISTRRIPVEERIPFDRTPAHILVEAERRKRLYVGTVKLYSQGHPRRLDEECSNALGVCNHARLHRCAVCQAWFIAHWRTKVCSDTCNKVAAAASLKRFRSRERKNRERPTANCKVCGKPFEPQRTTRLYCSDACQQKAYRERKCGRSNRDRLHQVCL
jgi:predicted nucleic acid-binding Zn ribbon protein